MRISSYTLLVLLIVSFQFVAWPDARAQEIEPPDVYRLVARVSGEVEHLRWIMGRPMNDQPPPDVKGVSPHEVYFQAVTFYEKVNRLAFELTQESVWTDFEPGAVIRPSDVHDIIRQARERLQFVEYSLGINSEVAMPPRSPAKTPTDVFQAVVQANRQVNLMLDRRFSPSDVFTQVTIALSYAERILAALPDATPPPASPEFVPGIQPADVYKRLLKNFELIRRIGQKRGLSMLTLGKWTDDTRSIHPGDVFDVASLLVAELVYLHKNQPGAEEPRKVLKARGKFPSDVYQRAAVLEGVLKDILERME